MDDLKLLEAATNPEKKTETIQEPEPEMSHEAFKSAAEETLKKEAQKQPEPENPKEAPAPKPLSIFDELKMGTEEDETMTPKGLGDKITEIASDVSSGMQEPDSFTEAKIKAESHIGLVDVGFSIVACIVLKDFSDSIYAKFSLSAERRKVLVHSMARMYQQMKVKSNPKVEVILLIAGSYVPLIWLLFMTKKKRMEEAANPQPARPAFLPDESQAPVIPIPTGNQYYDQFGSVNNKKRGVKPGSTRGPYKKG